MSRSMLLVFLLMILIITSQFEWRQPLVSEIDTNSSVTQKQLQASKREEAVKEKIIISQEKIIHHLNEEVRGLQRQLQQCRCINDTNTSTSALSDSFSGLEQHQIIED